MPGGTAASHAACRVASRAPTVRAQPAHGAKPVRGRAQRHTLEPAAARRPVRARTDARIVHGPCTPYPEVPKSTGRVVRRLLCETTQAKRGTLHAGRRRISQNEVTASPRRALQRADELALPCRTIDSLEGKERLENLGCTLRGFSRSPRRGRCGLTNSPMGLPSW